MTASSAVELVSLTKVYGGVTALDAVDLSVPEGSVFGFLGPNGAGKTTTLRILTGLTWPTSGSAYVFGADATSATSTVRARIGFLPDVPGFYDWMTAEEFLRFAGSLFGIDRRTLDERTGALVDMAGLSGVTTRLGGYSRGMKQRLGIAQALVNAPALLLLDEPTSALDPLGRKDVLDMIASLSGRTTVFFSTHILSDVERVCDTVAVLDRGHVVAQAPVGELKARYGAQKIVVEVTQASEQVERLLRRTPSVSAVTRENHTLTLTVNDVDEARIAVPAAIASVGAGIVRMESGEVSLEDIFVELVGSER